MHGFGGRAVRDIEFYHTDGRSPDASGSMLTPAKTVRIYRGIMGIPVFVRGL